MDEIDKDKNEENTSDEANDRMNVKRVHFDLRETITKQRDVSPGAYSQEPSKLKTLLYWMCGIESLLKANDSTTSSPSNDPNQIAFNYVDTSIDQDPMWARVCNVNAVVAISLSGFFIAFFNKYD